MDTGGATAQRGGWRGQPKPSEAPPDLVEGALEAALAAGLTEAEFWSSTPYQTALAVRARSKRQFELAATTGWFSERFAREERLNGLDYYLRPNPNLAAEEAEAEIARWAAGYGLEVVDLDPDE